MTRFRMAVPLAALSIALVAALAFAEQQASDSADAKATAQAKIGEPAPDFTLKDQDGNDVSLSDYKGKIVVLEQFNDVCPYVVKWYREGHMNRLAEKYTEQGVVWLAIDSTNDTNVEQNKAIAEQWKIDRPLLDDHSTEVARAYRARTTPQMRIISPEGVLLYDGAIDSKPTADIADIETSEKYFERALEQVLAGETVSQPETKPYGCAVRY